MDLTSMLPLLMMMQGANKNNGGTKNSTMPDMMQLMSMMQMLGGNGSFNPTPPSQKSEPLNPDLSNLNGMLNPEMLKILGMLGRK